MSLWTFAQAIGDTLANLTTGMGTGADKSTATGFVQRLVTDQECLAAYRSDWLSRSIIDIPVDDETREWRSWQAEQPQIEKLEEEEARLDLVNKVGDARRLARIYGGAGLVIGTGDTDPTAPLDPESIAGGGLAYLMALPRHKLVGEEIDWTPGAHYGLPTFYSLSSAELSTRIHHSRVIRFVGARVPMGEAAELAGWGDPILLSIYDAVAAAGVTIQSVAALLLEAKVDVVGIPRLLERSGNQKDRESLLARFSLAAIAKSNHGVFMRDLAEEWEQKQISFAQMPELIDRFLQIVSGAADIPATRLLGQSPAGMNATGEGDLINYYDRIRAGQNTVLRPALKPLDEMLIRSALGTRPPKVHYDWRPLWQMSEKDKAEVQNKKADTASKHKALGLIPETALAKGLTNQLVEDGVYPGLEGALAEAEKAKELAPFEEPDPVMGGVDPVTGLPTPGQPRQLPGQSPRRPIPLQRAANDARPRPLYVSRPVVNAADLIEWAREQGFKTTLPADQLHVTIAYSRRALDWAAIAPDTAMLTADRRGPDGRDTWRWVTKLGKDGAVVLVFESAELRARWQAFIDAGASWDFEEFWPHVTISYDAAEYLEPWTLNAFLGPLEFGPERYDALSDDPDDQRPREVSTEGGTT